MTTSLEQAVAGLASYAELDVLPLLPNGTKKLLSYMAVAGFRRNPAVVLAPYERFLKAFGILSEDGRTVDTTSLVENLKVAFANVPNVEFCGITFEAKDVDKLVSRLGG